ncbi:cytochrome c-type biogenesis protein [Sphingomicrobium flavum]|uniref:cytochrome c-type biogenesis protein n=1 Tax=Sphingomicrobium flavum TaxID=1229164 RepID=UPI0021ADAF52|nr:cytochrome c-type biogenesis protein [Sphingomicrobium flavum]
MKLWLLALALLVASPAFAQGRLADAEFANRQLPDAAEERAAHDLMAELRCLVCQGQSIIDSDADMAGDMRHLIRTRIAAGESPEQIRAYLIERYGDWVSYRPAAGNRLFWPLYAAPILLLALGLFMLRRRFRRRGQ